MALFLKDHSIDKIISIGQKKSKALLVYIKPQDIEWISLFLLDMIAFNIFLILLSVPTTGKENLFRTTISSLENTKPYCSARMVVISILDIKTSAPTLEPTRGPTLQPKFCYLFLFQGKTVGPILRRGWVIVYDLCHFSKTKFLYSILYVFAWDLPFPSVSIWKTLQKWKKMTGKRSRWQLFVTSISWSTHWFKQETRITIASY